MAALLEDERVVGLAEVMNFPGAVAGDAGVLGKLGTAKDYPVDGHAPGLSGHALKRVCPCFGLSLRAAGPPAMR